MASRTPIILIVGILIGAIAGYGVLSTINAPIINDYINSISQNEIEILSLTSELDDQVEEYELLQDENTELDTETESLSTDLSTLTAQYETLESSFEELLQKYEIVIASLPLSAAPISAETIDMEYTWYFKGRKFTLPLSIPESMYEYYSEKKRAETEDYSIYVTHPYDDEYINTIIQKMNFIALDRGYSELENQLDNIVRSKHALHV